MDTSTKIKNCRRNFTDRPHICELVGRVKISKILGLLSLSFRLPDPEIYTSMPAKQEIKSVLPNRRCINQIINQSQNSCFV